MGLIPRIVFGLNQQNRALPMAYNVNLAGSTFTIYVSIVGLSLEASLNYWSP